ncbi:hypothetical protein [Nocardia abscessus]|uniref:hypothetical protein n=1 Tax=Nocardia abscessus TaxID=120957 RepID=UPI002458337C|nr:hypothetical protein [Nocardia abscessus]
MSMRQPQNPKVQRLNHCHGVRCRLLGIPTVAARPPQIVRRCHHAARTTSIAEDSATLDRGVPATEAGVSLGGEHARSGR